MTYTHIYDQTRHGPWWFSLLKGWFRRCPNCTEGKIFQDYLSVEDTCQSCGLELHKQRADDLPPYITITIVGHIVVPLIVLVEKVWSPDLVWQMIGWSTLTILLTLYFLPRVKGAMIALQWVLGLHGFDGKSGETSDVQDT